MKKNKEFDSIEQQLNDAIHAPASVDKGFVLSALEGSDEQQKPNILPLKQKSTSKKALPTLAAAIAVVLIGAIGFGVIPKLTHTDVIKNTSGGEALTAYSSYTELKKDVKELEQTQPIFEKFTGFFPSKKGSEVVDYAADSSLKSNAEGITSTYGETFTQVEGVDEDDFIKTDGKYIYYACYRGSEEDEWDEDVEYYYDEQPYVFIFSAEGKKAKLVQSIALTKKDYYEINGIYLSDNKLIVELNNYEKTTVKIFDVSDIDNIHETASFSQSGHFSASRLIGDKLFVVSNQTNIGDIPFIYCNDTKKDLAADKIYKTENPSEAQFLVISRIDIHSKDKIEEAKAVLGGSSKVYCNEEHMYVLANINGFGARSEENYHQKSQLFKIDISDGIRFTASTKLNGSAKNQYAMDEYNGIFRIAVTDYTKNWENTNRLYTFDEELNLLGKLNDFAKEEHIEAVKFVGETAYVITYETTDPLFVIDLANAGAPQLLGKVKIDGFSTTLIPVGDDKLLGIGTDEDFSGAGLNSLKLVLFDISDKMHPAIADEKVCKHITSDAMYETKAILKNSGNGQFTLYSTFYDDITKKYDRTDDYYYYDYDTVYGCLSFAVENGQIVLKNTYRSDELESGIGRCTFVENTVYMIDDCQNIDCTNY